MEKIDEIKTQLNFENLSADGKKTAIDAYEMDIEQAASRERAAIRQLRRKI